MSIKGRLAFAAEVLLDRNMRGVMMFHTIQQLEAVNQALEPHLASIGCTYNPMMRRWSNEQTGSELRLDFCRGKHHFDHYRGMEVHAIAFDEIPEDLMQKILRDIPPRPETTVRYW